MKDMSQYEWYVTVWKICHSMDDMSRYEWYVTVWKICHRMICCSIEDMSQYEWYAMVWQICHSMDDILQYGRYVTVWMICQGMADMSQYGWYVVVGKFHYCLHVSCPMPLISNNMINMGYDFSWPFKLVITVLKSWHLQSSKCYSYWMSWHFILLKSELLILNILVFQKKSW